MGQLGANLGNPNVTDPRQARPQDLDASEGGARMIAGGTKGLMQGFSNYQQQNQALRQPSGGQMQVPMAQQPQVQLPGMNQDANNPFKMRGNNLAFYGGQ